MTSSQGGTGTDDQGQAIVRMSKETEKATIWQLGELDKRLSNTLGAVENLEAATKNAVTDAFMDVVDKISEFEVAAAGLQTQIDGLKNVQLDRDTTDVLIAIKNYLSMLSDSNFYDNIRYAVDENKYDFEDLKKFIRETTEKIQSVRNAISDEVSSSIQTSLDDFYQNANNFTENVKLAVEKASKSFDETAGAKMKELEKSVDDLLDAKIKRFKSRQKHIEQMEDFMANGKWWVGGIAAFLALIVISCLTSTFSNYSKQREAEKVIEDARYWRYYKSYNPQTTANFAKEVDRALDEQAKREKGKPTK